MRGLPIKYYKHIMEKTGAVADEFNIFVFKRLKKTIKSRIITAENAE